MPGILKSFRIKSNNICYGLEPDVNDEVEQYLTIAATGRVRFSSRNYNQCLNDDGFLQKEADKYW